LEKFTVNGLIWLLHL